MYSLCVAPPAWICKEKVLSHLQRKEAKDNFNYKQLCNWRQREQAPEQQQQQQQQQWPWPSSFPTRRRCCGRRANRSSSCSASATGKWPQWCSTHSASWWSPRPVSACSARVASAASGANHRSELATWVNHNTLTATTTTIAHRSHRSLAGCTSYSPMFSSTDKDNSNRLSAASQVYSSKRLW